MTETTTPDHPHAERALLLAVVSLSSFVTPFLGSSLNLAIPAIGRDLHAGAVALNWVVTAYLVASAVFLIPFGRLADLVGRRRLVLIGVGFALFSSPNSNAVMGAVEPRHYGVASATLGTMRLVGQALSMATVALVFAVLLGDAHVTAEAAPGLLAANRVAFSLFAGLCGVGVFASLARGRVHVRTAS